MPVALSAITAMVHTTSTTTTARRSGMSRRSSSSLLGAVGAIGGTIEMAAEEEEEEEAAAVFKKATRSRLDTEAVAAGMPVALSAITAMVHTTSTTTTARRSGVSRRSSSSLLGAVGAIGGTIEMAAEEEEEEEAAAVFKKATRSRLDTEAVAAGIQVASRATTAMAHSILTTTTARRSGVSRRSSSSLSREAVGDALEIVKTVVIGSKKVGAFEKAIRSRHDTEAVAAGMPDALDATTAMG
eukprot:scaffold2915_cov229-Pinguiococcus_pyrenoidosus.AAC.1